MNPPTKEGGWLCDWCGEVFRSSTQLRQHPCGAKAAARRAKQLRWPTAPVERFLTARYGECTDTVVAAVLKIGPSSWSNARERGLTDVQADHIATELARPAEAFWPGWHSALEVTDDDLAVIERWVATGRTTA